MTMLYLCKQCSKAWWVTLQEKDLYHIVGTSPEVYNGVVEKTDIASIVEFVTRGVTPTEVIPISEYQEFEVASSRPICPACAGDLTETYVANIYPN